MGRIFFIPGVLVLAAAAAAGGAWYWLTSGFEARGPLREDMVLIVPKGAGVNAIADDLASAGIIADARIFKYGHRFLAAPGAMRAGEYRFPAAISTAGAIKLLQSGRTVVRKITLAEGLSNHEIAAVLERTPGLTGALGGFPEEGRLLPETYHFSFGDSRAAVIARMAKAATELMAALWPARAADLPIKTPAEALVLASIVEKETGVAAERARIAGVFHNRLRKGMRRQSDPTVIYGLTHGRSVLGRPLTQSDLKSDTPYNTYVIKGLPPAPIANPGRAAIEAVLKPMSTKDLYFVADGTGGHAFAETLAGHKKNVAAWRKIERARRQQAQ